jgi:hypothetical protein
MNKTDTHAFINQLLVYTLVTIGFSGSVGLGTVWLRHQISVAANHTKQIEARIDEVERHLAETEASIATERGPDALNQRNAAWRLGLVLAKEPQVIRVNENVELRLEAKRNQGVFADGVRPVVFRTGGTASR